MNDRAVPGMFHRRLLLIAGLMLAVMMLLGAQLVRLTVIEGGPRRARAESILHRRTLLPTFRGSVLDREGRILAVDRPGYAVAVEYDVITGAWEQRQAARQARRELGAGRWATLSDEARDEAARRRLAPFRAQTERLWAAVREHGGIDAEELRRRRERIRRDVEDLADRVWERQREAERRKYGGTRVPFRRGPIREQEQPHVVLPSVSDEVAFSFRALARDLPGLLAVENARRRVYPWTAATVPIDRRHLPRPLASEAPLTVRVEGVADHVLGAMREVQAEDVARRPFRPRPGAAPDLGGYRRVGDFAGARGIERTFEDHLRGTRGEVRRRLDSGDERRVPHEPGGEVRLTLDIALQARVQALLSDEIGLTTVQAFHQNPGLPVGWPLNAGVVVLEVATGEILALVSMPTRATGAYLAGLDRDRERIDQPWVNRPVEAIYPPGSIVKPIVLVAGITEGVHALDEPIECTGHYFPHVTTHARCWIFRERWDFATHGEVRAEDALGQSCNIFFYTLGDRMGLSALTAWCRRFGLGAPLNVGLLEEDVDPETGERTRRGESGGWLLTDEQIAALSPTERRFDAISMAIGQGRSITWTPVQAANAYATLARGGERRDVTLVTEPRGWKGAETGAAALALDPAAVEAALEGLRRSVSPGGTGHHLTHAPGDTEPIFNAEGVTVWGKTGTAQAPPLRTKDTSGDGAIDSRDEGITDLDHAWFVGLVGPNDTGRPMFAIAVIAEFGGSGGRVAGPIANQVIRALQHEGYLPDRAFSTVGADG